MNLPSAPAALFDWDGVLIDSSRQHEKSWELLAVETGLNLPPDHFRRGFGRKNEVIIPEILGWARDEAGIRKLSLRKEELYRDLVRREGVEALPGAREFLERLRAARIPCAIGSSTHRLNILTCLELMGLGEFFAGIVSAEDVDRGKPDPRVFTLAAGLLSTPPALCVVFEDAPVGVEAALRGGMKAVGVAGSIHDPASLSAAHRIVRRLDELSAADVFALFTESP